MDTAQTCAAHRADGGRVVVVLSQREKLDMEALYRCAGRTFFTAGAARSETITVCEAGSHPAAGVAVLPCSLHADGVQKLHRLRAS